MRFEGASADPSSWPYRRCTEILCAIYVAQRNVAAYIALADQVGIRPEDCLAVARLLAARRPEESLAWVERARALDRNKPFQSTAGYDLDGLHRELLTRLGRQSEALEAAWATFGRTPRSFPMTI